MPSRYYNRTFLNKVRGTALIEVDISADEYGVNCDVSITDCCRKVTLDLNSSDQKEDAKMLAKLDRLINALLMARKRFKDAVVVAEGLRKKRLAEKAAKKKQEI